MKAFFLCVLVCLLSTFSFGQKLAKLDSGAEAKLALVEHPEAGTDSQVNTTETAVARVAKMSGSFVFEDKKGKVKLLVYHTKDSINLKAEFANNSKSSFYIHAAKPLTYRWNPGNLLVVDCGSDGTAFHESEFPVTQIKAGETKQFSITLPNKSNKFKMNLKVSYYESPAVAADALVLNSAVKHKKGNWNWSQYYVPVLLKR